MTEKHIRRRLEAVPFTWDRLTPTQQSAVNDIAGCFLDALGAIDDPTRGVKAPSDPLDRDRRSQLAFIDGDRGTGKSSVLLTLRDLTSGRREVSNALPAQVRGLKSQAQRIVWLETLDMEPLTSDTNLFAAILVRIANVFDPGSRASPAPPLAVLDERDGRSSAMAELHRLQTDAILVWDGVGKRGGSEPHAHAAEVLRAERAGLELNRRLGGVLDTLTDTLRRRDQGDPLLVLPVDDFDLAPRHALDLLRLIRMVTTKRLFFVIAGSVRIAESVLQLASEGELRALAGSAPADPAKPKSLSIEISANNMRKLIPPGQRAHLTTLRLEEARKLVTGPGEPTLDSATQAIELEVNQGPTNSNRVSLAKFLLLDDSSPVAGSFASRWLGGTPRQVLDRVLAFDQLEGFQEEWGRAFHLRMCNELSRDLHEEWQLAFDDRERLKGLLDTTLSVQIDLKSLLSVHHDHATAIVEPFAGGTLASSMPGPSRWYLRGGERTRRYERQEEEPKTELPSRLAAGFSFLHDTAVSLWGSYLRTGSLARDAGAGPSARIHWGAPRDERLAVEWNQPDWWTFRDRERFAAHWNRHLEQADGRYSRAWLTAMLEVLMDQECIAGALGEQSSRILPFLEDLLRETPKREARRVLRESALVVITLLLAPEAGCTPSDAKEVLSLPGFGSALSSDLATRVRIWRARAYHAARQDEARTAGSYELRCRISPSLALEEARTDLRELSPKGSELSDDQLVLGAKQTGRETKVKGRGSESAFIDAMSRALKHPFKNHPLNTFKNGQLVPTEVEIDQQNPHVTSRGAP